MTKEELSSKARYIKMVFPFDKEMFEDHNYGEEIADVAYMIEDGNWNITVDLSSHKMVNHKEGTPCIYVYSKARNSGRYTLLDEQGHAICEIRGYVPNGVIPPHEGFGDYIMFTLWANGNIGEWYDEYDFSEFEEEGLSEDELYAGRCPSLTTDNFGFVIEKVVMPLEKRYFEAMAVKSMEHYALRSDGIYLSNTYKNDSLDSISLYFSSKMNGSIQDMMPTKSIWFYYHCSNVRTPGMRGAVHLYLPIYLYNDGYKMGLIGKIYPYGTLPPEQDVANLLAGASDKLFSLMLAEASTYSFD